MSSRETVPFNFTTAKQFSGLIYDNKIHFEYNIYKQRNGMWPLLKKFVLKHYKANSIQSLIYTQMYNRFIVIEKEDLCMFLKIRTIISSVQAVCKSVA